MKLCKCKAVLVMGLSPAFPSQNTKSSLLLLLLSRFSHVQLCDPIGGSPPGSPVPGILQARTLEWVAISFSNAGKWKVKVKSLSCVWFFSDPMDCSPPVSSVHGIFQARVLEWGAIAFSTYQPYSASILQFLCRSNDKVRSKRVTVAHLLLQHSFFQTDRY